MKNIKRILIATFLVFITACSNGNTDVADKENTNNTEEVVENSINYKEVYDKANKKFNELKSVTIDYSDDLVEKALLKYGDLDETFFKAHGRITDKNNILESEFWCEKSKGYTATRTDDRETKYMAQDTCLMDPYHKTKKYIKDKEIDRYEKQEKGIVYLLNTDEDKNVKNLLLFVNSDTGLIEQIQYKEKAKSCSSGTECYKTVKMHFANYNDTECESVDLSKFKK